jgi:hypothetical protein
MAELESVVRGITESLGNVWQGVVRLGMFTKLGFSPEPMVIYKPTKGDTGSALKLDLRVEPTFNNGGYVDSASGGLWLEIAPQSGFSNGFAQFAWTDKTRTVAAKLGLADIQAILTAIRQVRYLGKTVPMNLRPYKEPETKPTMLGRFHKNQSGSTIIEVNFEAERTLWSVSKGPTHRGRVALTLDEELLLETYLRISLEAFMKVGLR